jgi:hypothetical protein
MDAAVVYHWRSAFPGRELAAVALKREVDQFLTKAMVDGRIVSFDWFISTTGDLNYLVVRGEAETLMAMTSDPDLMLLNLKSGMINDGLTWSLCAAGETVDATTGLYESAAASLT